MNPTEPSPRICDYEGSDYQERFWDRGERAYEDRVEAVALSRLLPRSGSRLLEIGAGAGRNTPRYVGFNEIVLLDYSRTQLQEAQSRLGRSDRYRFVLGDVYRLPFSPGSFDSATMIRTLHHMADPPTALSQTREILQSGGTFILEFANKQNLKAIVRWILRRQRWNPFDLEPVEFAPLNFDFHPRAVRNWLSGAGFSIDRQLTVSHFRLAWLKKIVPIAWLVGLDSALQRTGGWVQYTPSVFVRAIAEGGGQPVGGNHFWRCPECRSVEIEEDASECRCTGCGRRWQLKDGIYDFKDPVS